MWCALSVLVIAFLGSTATGESAKQHITYYLDEICDDGQKMIAVSSEYFNSSVIVKSSRKSSGFTGKCAVVFTVDTPGTFGDGFLVTSQYFNASDYGNCENYIEFYAGRKRITRWCDSNSIDEFGSFSTSLTVNFNTKVYETLNFEMVLTVYSRPVPIINCFDYIKCKDNRSGMSFCVAKELKCDGIRHCMNGEDQEGCTPPLSTTIIPSTTSSTHHTTFPITTETSTTVKTTVTTSPSTTQATTTEKTPRTTNATQTTTTPVSTTTEASSTTTSETITTTASTKNVTITSTSAVPTSTETGSTSNTTATSPTASTNSTRTTSDETTVTSNTTMTTPVTTSTSNGTVTARTTTESGPTTNGTEVPTTAAPPVSGSSSKVLAIVLGVMFGLAILIVIAWFAYKYYKNRGSYDRL